MKLKAVIFKELLADHDRLEAEIAKLKEENSELRDGSPVKPQTTKE